MSCDDNAYLKLSMVSFEPSWIFVQEVFGKNIVWFFDWLIMFEYEFAYNKNIKHSFLWKTGQVAILLLQPF